MSQNLVRAFPDCTGALNPARSSVFKTAVAVDDSRSSGRNLMANERTRSELNALQLITMVPHACYWLTTVANRLSPASRCCRLWDTSAP